MVDVLLFVDRCSDARTPHASGLSYAGDPRMIVGENQNKVRNIVDGHLYEFKRVYRDTLKQSGLTLPAETAQEQNNTVPGEDWLLRRPAGMMERGSAALVGRPNNAALQHTVQRSSFAQMALGVFSAGPAKAAVYAAEKLGKWVQGILQSRTAGKN
jgi:hypothetical protein